MLTNNGYASLVKLKVRADLCNSLFEKKVANGEMS
jgi:hypothetical protein